MVLNSYGNCAGANNNLWSGSNQRLALLDSGATRARWQQKWASRETSQGVFDWTIFDDYVTTCHSDGTFCDWVLQNAPTWYQTTLTIDSGANVPQAAAAANQATREMQRAQSLGAKIHTYEAGNEGFNTQNLTSSNSPQFFAQVKDFIKQVGDAVHAVDPTCLIGAPAELTKESTVVNAYTDGFFASGCHKLVDYVNFHFYPGKDPDSPAAGKYGLKQWLNAWKTAMQAHGVSIPIWITEWGWKIQVIGDTAYNSYLTTFMNDVIASNLVQAVFQFDLDSTVPSKQFNSASTYQTYKTWKKFIATTPNFGPTSTSGGGTGGTGGGGSGGGTGGTGGSSQPTVYLSAQGSSTLATAGQLYMAAGTPATSYNVTEVDTSTGYGEVTAQGTLNAWVNTGSILAPTGKGFLLETSVFDFSGQQFNIDVWTATLTLSTTGTGAASITADIHCRIFIRSSGGTYTQLVHLQSASQAIGTTAQQYILSQTPTTTTAFKSGDQVYLDLWLNVTTNTGALGQQIALNQLSTDTTGKTGSTKAQVVMPSYQAAPSTPPPPPPPPPPSGGGGSTGGGGTGSGGGVGGGGTGGGFVLNPTPSAVTVNGVPYFALAGSLQVENTIGKRASASCTLLTDTSVHFEQYQQFAVFDQTNTLAFSGYLTQPQEMKPGFQPFLLHSVTSCDQHYLADKRVVAATYTNKTCGYMAQDIVSNVLAQEGVLVGQIYDGIVPDINLYPERTLYPGGNIGLVPSASFVYCTAAQAFDELVKAASSSGVPYYWMIDQNLQLWFVPYTAVKSDIVVDGSLIDQARSAPTVTRQNPTYRNTQYIIGGSAQTVQQTESRKGDGTTTAWTMGYAMATVPTITVNGTAKTVGIKGLDTGKNFYWSKGDPIITQDSAATKLVSTDTLSVTYYGQYPTIVVATNDAQISYQSGIDGSTGIIEQVTQDAAISDVTSGQFEAGQLLSRYATQGTQLQFMTSRSGFAPGQLVTVNLPDHNLVNTQMLIAKVSASDQQDGINIWYTVTGVIGPYDITWIDFFSDLLKTQAPANSINIGVSQTVVISAAFAASLTPSASLIATSYACPLPASTLKPSTTLYPC